MLLEKFSSTELGLGLIGIGIGIGIGRHADNSVCSTANIEDFNQTN